MNGASTMISVRDFIWFQRVSEVRDRVATLVDEDLMRRVDSSTIRHPHIQGTVSSVWRFVWRSGGER